MYYTRFLLCGAIMFSGAAFAVETLDGRSVAARISSQEFYLVEVQANDGRQIDPRTQLAQNSAQQQQQLLLQQQEQKRKQQLLIQQQQQQRALVQQVRPVQQVQPPSFRPASTNSVNSKNPTRVAPSTYTFSQTPNGTVQVLQNGKLISTTTPQFAAQQYGYQIPSGYKPSTPRVPTPPPITSGNFTTPSGAVIDVGTGKLMSPPPREGGNLSATTTTIGLTPLTQKPSTNLKPLNIGPVGTRTGGVTTPQTIPSRTQNSGNASGPLPKSTPQAGQQKTQTQTTNNLVPLSPYNPSPAYKAQMQAKVAEFAPSNGQAAGFAGYSPELAKSGINPYGRGYCTDYAKKLYSEVTGKPLQITGDAGTWYTKAQDPKTGLQTLPASEIKRIPPGAIAVWEGTTDKTKAGHVAVVEQNTGTSIKFTEANWGILDSRYASNLAITENFNKVTESPSGYSYMRAMTHANPSTGTPNGYKLVGFILP